MLGLTHFFDLLMRSFTFFSSALFSDVKCPKTISLGRLFFFSFWARVALPLGIVGQRS